MAKRILAVDDEPDILSMMESWLGDLGFEVLSAANGEKAFKMAREEKPNLIILDIMLPKMNGYKVCGLLKKDSRYAKIPIILFSARVQEEDKRLGQEVGADAYVSKPFEPDALLGKIQALIQ